MNNNAAVIAHFDPNNRLEKNFQLVLQSLEQVFDIVVLVTACDLAEADVALFKKVILIKRPNIGYDFYSYRVGLSYLEERVEVSNILLVNSSFIVLDAEIFTRTLGNMLNMTQSHDVVSITESRQFNWHLQSYLILLSNKVLQAVWFKTFFANIQPLNSKLEIILSYEIGLSGVLLNNDVNVLVLFKPSTRQRTLAEVSWMRKIARKGDWLTLKPFRHRREVNWTHFCAKEIAQQFGFVKTEVLRTNPHGISTDFVSEIGHPDNLNDIEVLLDKSRNQYKAGINGLTTMTYNPTDIIAGRIISFGRARAKGVKVAVVIHLFYYDLLAEICSYLNGIVEPYDLYVTTPFEGDIHKIINNTSVIAHSVTVFLAENRGRDIGPFISLFRSGLLDGYLAVLKLHSKKSKYSSQGAEWRKQLLSKVVGNSLMIRQTLQLFEQGNIGLVGPHQFYLSHDSFWGANYENVKHLLNLTGHHESSAEPKLGFIAGSMFWFYPKAFAHLKDIPEESLDFQPECGMQDGTLAHAIERIFCSVAMDAGYKVTSVSLAGQDFSEIDTQHNRVPVLE
jgi:rhamnosyltransferase